MRGFLRLRIALFCSICLPLILAGCGYGLRKAENPLQDLGIRKVFISNFTNKTYRPGLEYFFTKAMVQEIERYGAFSITNNVEEADATISGVIFGIKTTPVSKGVRIDGETSAAIATSYQGTINCTVTMTDRFGRGVFNGTFGASKAFPASLVLSGAESDVVRGANDTAPLISNSEERLAMRFLARQLMADAYQRLTDIF